MLNVVALQGRMTRDPELRHTQAGKSVTSFSLAVERDFGKGRMIGVTGRLQVREWQDRDGNKRRSAEVQADRIYFLDSKRDNGYDAPSDYGMPSYASEPSGFSELDEADGNLPF